MLFMSSFVQQPSRAITAEEAGLVDQLRIKFPPSGTESYGMPLDDASLVRYLRARDGSVDKAAAMLTATLEWRREFGLPEASKIYALDIWGKLVLLYCVSAAAVSNVLRV